MWQSLRKFFWMILNELRFANLGLADFYSQNVFELISLIYPWLH